MTVGENIKRIRKERGLTQKELGGLLDMTQSAIGQFENDKTSPKTDTIEKIASALGVSPSELMKGNSIWEEFDKQYPNVGKEATEFEDFIQFLKSIGYVVKTVSESDTYLVKVSKDGTTTTFSQKSFENFQLETKKSVDYQVWLKSQEKK
jgi:transcriptional regulator with XRE-family HTH domain